MGTDEKVSHSETYRTEALAELKAIRHELWTLREAFETFASIFLNSRFPYGKADDMFARRRPRG